LYKYIYIIQNKMKIKAYFLITITLLILLINKISTEKVDETNDIKTIISGCNNLIMSRIIYDQV
jgi:hypothetical protein